MLVEKRRDVILGCLRPSYLFILLLGVCHAGLHPGPDDRQFKFCRDCRHLDKGLAHGVYIACPAVDCDAAEDLQLHPLAFDDVDDLTELLCAAAQSRDFGAYESASSFRNLQEKIKILLHLGVAVFALRDDFRSSCGLQLPDLSVAQSR